MAADRPITKLLVANRGEIARRVFATCRRMGIGTVAVFSDPDADALHVRDADEAVALGGETAADSYLRSELVIEAARKTGADAVHPGYGFLAENSEFAQAVSDAGLTWIGPPPGAIESMGSKVRARAMMEEAGVPILPGAELGPDSDPASEAEAIGYPLLVKASAGGGGKGMRTVTEPGDLGSAVEGARREAESSFGDPTVFLERFLERPRHVEIQVFADRHGDVVSLGERECSIQRRHQKVVEESPSPAVDPQLRERMGSAAVEAARAVDYEGAGTVEFLLGPDGDFYFLEMNTRLQVEHPVTELVTGLDLVRLQLLVAAGEPLPAAAHEVELRGHAVEVRLYAEDPASGFLPQTGLVSGFAFEDPADGSGAGEFTPPDPEPGTAPSFRLDSGIGSGSLITPHYDPMLAKVIAWAPSREEAAGFLARGLENASVHGPPNNRDFLVRLLRHPAYLAGETDTGFIERHEGLAEPLIDAEGERVSAAAAALASAERSGRSGPLGFAPRGWRNNRSGPQTRTYEGADGEIEVAYSFTREGLELEVDGEPVVAELGEVSGPDSAATVRLRVDGVERPFKVSRGADRELFVDSPLGQARLRESPRYPGAETAAAEGALVAPMPGKVLELRVAVGDSIEAGAVVAVLEAMKMEHELTAPAAGTVAELAVGEGDQVDSGKTLAVIEPA